MTKQRDNVLTVLLLTAAFGGTAIIVLGLKAGAISALLTFLALAIALNI